MQGSSTTDSSLLHLESPAWNPSCSDKAVMSQSHSVTPQPSPQQFPQDLKVHLESGCKLSKLHVIQLDSQDFFVYCLLNHFPLLVHFLITHTLLADAGRD